MEKEPSNEVRIAQINAVAQIVAAAIEKGVPGIQDIKTYITLVALSIRTSL